MKTSKLPDKIYLHSINEETLEFTRFWSYAPFERDDVINVEYIRTDVFIKNVENWLINNTDITSTGIKNFRKAMKGK